MSYDQLKLKNQLCHRLYIASNNIIRSYRIYLDELDLTYPQYVVMMALWEKDKVQVSELEEKTQIDAGSLSLILQKLITKKFIKTQSDEIDKRKKIVSLTDRGEGLKKKAAKIPSQVSCHTPKFTHEQAVKLAKLLDELNLDFND